MITDLVLRVSGREDALDIALNILDRAGVEIKEAFLEANVAGDVMVMGDNLLEVYR